MTEREKESAPAVEEQGRAIENPVAVIKDSVQTAIGDIAGV